MPTKNDVATAKQDRYKIFSDYVDNHANEIYIDYRDELSKEQVSQILEGKLAEVRWEIEDNAMSYMDREDYYWTHMAEELKVEKDEIFEWLDDEGFWPHNDLTDDGMRRLMENTSVEITAIVWDAEWNFYNWAYGGPVNYSDVKESLRILGINPLEFKKAFDDSSVSLGGSHRLRGYFPDMPNRKPAVDVNELRGNMIVLYDGVLNFCLGDLAQVAEVASGETKNITFKAGTNVVMYDFGNGAGITEVQLKEDVTIPRKKVEFKNDNESRYGIQSCYGFVHSYWTEGSVQNG
jgi:hypothetical protein